MGTKLLIDRLWCFLPWFQSSETLIESRFRRKSGIELYYTYSQSLSSPSLSVSTSGVVLSTRGWKPPLVFSIVFFGFFCQFHMPYRFLIFPWFPFETVFPSRSISSEVFAQAYHVSCLLFLPLHSCARSGSFDLMVSNLMVYHIVVMFQGSVRSMQLNSEEDKLYSASWDTTIIVSHPHPCHYAGWLTYALV